MAKFLFRKFKFKFTLILITAMLFMAALSNFLIYGLSLRFQFNDLRDKLMICVQNATLMIDAGAIKQIPLNNEEGLRSEAYQQVLSAFKQAKKADPLIRHIYAMGMTQKKGVWQFIVDPNAKIGREKRSEMLKALNGPSADKKLEVGEWGATLSAYAPIRDSDGNPAAILGLDMSAEDIYILRQKIHFGAVFVLVVGLIVSLFLGRAVAEGVTDRIEKLVVGTRKFASGDLAYRVRIKGNDEISELGRSLNEMAKSLHESRRKLFSYFYDVSKSLVRIIEAREHHMKGHSEKVAGYAVKIAKKMGFSEDKIELLEETALLHDIGKLGIEENILNKKEKLTDAEWEMIRQHPIIGEDMLKPITLTPELLAVIRSHHERYDGKGYPDKLIGENIGVFASILSVADAYDAMVTERPYRRVMTKEEAIEELKRCSGSQFNPKIVDIFLSII